MMTTATTTTNLPPSLRPRRKGGVCPLCGGPTSCRRVARCWRCVGRRAPFRSRVAERVAVGESIPTPQRPTECLPGTPGKLLVMADRAERGEQLFHPDDAGRSEE